MSGTIPLETECSVVRRRLGPWRLLRAAGRAFACEQFWYVVLADRGGADYRESTARRRTQRRCLRAARVAGQENR